MTRDAGNGTGLSHKRAGERIKGKGKWEERLTGQENTNQEAGSTARLETGRHLLKKERREGKRSWRERREDRG